MTRPYRRTLKHKRVVFVTTHLQAGERIPPLLSLLLFLLDLNDFASFVEAAVGTDSMRQTHGAAIGAGDQVAGLEGVMGAAVVAAALRVFALWMWGHSTFSLILLSIFQSSGQIIAAGGRGVKCPAVI
jgi:tetrahydromethanopterin S-methyltransferase subunit D